MPRVYLALAVVCAIGCSPTRLTQVEPAETKPYIFHSLQRQSEGGYGPPMAMQTALEQREALIQAQGSTSSEDWHWEGPGNVGGRTRAILVHPKDRRILWVGSAGGGIWKTTTGGAAWFPLDDFLPSLSVSCLAMDPANPDVLYAGTGEGFAAVVNADGAAFNPGAGMFRTLDGGESWEQLPSTVSPGWEYVNRIAVCPSDSRILLVATSSGIYRSTNSGASFDLVHPGRTFDVRFHPADKNQALAGLADGRSLYTTDGGRRWRESSGLTGMRVELRYGIDKPKVVYAAVSQGDRVHLFISRNGGISFSLIRGLPNVETYDNYNLCLWVDPTNWQTAIVGGVWPFRTRDGGKTWSRPFHRIHTDMHQLVEMPGTSMGFLATDGGVYFIPDINRDRAIDVNNGLGITQCVGAAISPISGVLISGAMDNGTNLSDGTSTTWTRWVIQADGAYCAADQSNASYLYGEYQFANVFRSSNGGVSFDDEISPPGRGSRELFNAAAPLVLDPNYGKRMLVGGRFLWRSSDVTAERPTWVAITPEISPANSNPQTDFVANNISAIAITPEDSERVWIGYNCGQIWRSRNALDSSPQWRRLDTIALPKRFVSKIVIEPSQPQRVYVAFMGWEESNLWYTDDDGTKWHALTGLPSVSVTSLAVHPNHSKWLYVGTDIGLFTSKDGGTTWTTARRGPATVAISDMFWRPDGQLVLVTYGRGVFTGRP